MADPSPRFRSIGGYSIVAKLGEGGMGQVYRAAHPRFPGREFALKVLIGDEPPDPEAIARFERETRALATATAHPGIVRVFGGSFDGKVPFVVMELVNGTALDALARGAGLPADRAARMVREVCEAMHYVHEQGVVHRDLKPANVLVEAGDRPRVCDFGLAKIAGASRLTRSGAALGTPEYSAPEQLDGRAHEVDRRADVYSLGAVLYYALTGQPPFAGDRAGLLKRVLFDRVVRPSRLNGTVSRDLDTICLRALEKEPADRYPDAAALRDDLDRFRRGEPLASAPPRRRKSPLVVLAIVLALGGVAFAAWRRFEAGRERARAELEEVRRRAREAGFDEEAKPLLAAVSETLPATLVAFAKRSVAVPTRATLLGETAGTVALGHLLLDRRDVALAVAATRDATPEAAARATHDAALLLDGVAALVSEGGPAASALAAYLALAREGMPRRALGPGRVDTAVPDEVLAALARAPGLAASRAAWLRVDLLVCAGRDADAREARRGLDDDPCAGVLDAALGLHVDPAPGTDGVRAESERIATLERLLGDPETSPWLLSRYAARAGWPNLFEHPEVVDREGIAAALACDPANAFAFLPENDHPSLEQEQARERARAVPFSVLEHERVNPNDPTTDRSPEAVLRDLTEKRRRFGKKIDAGLARAIATSPDPLDAYVIGRASASYRSGLATGVLTILRAGASGESVQDLARAFDTESREQSRRGMGFDYYRAASWDADPLTEEGCLAFDARLDSELAADPPSAALATAAPAAFGLARRGAQALRRLEVAEAGAKLDRRFLIEALVGLEEMAKLRGPAVLVPRARARRLLLGKGRGDALAALDLGRAFRVVAHDERAWLRTGWLAVWAASHVPHDLDPELGWDLFLAGAHALREQEVCAVCDARKDRRPVGPGALREEIAGRRFDLKVWAFVAGLRAFVDDAAFDRVFVAPGRDEEARTRVDYVANPFRLAHARRLFPRRK